MRMVKEDVRGPATECAFYSILFHDKSNTKLICALSFSWDSANGAVLRANYFERSQDGKEYDYVTDFWRRWWHDFFSACRC